MKTKGAKYDESDEVLRLIDAYWRFDENQQPQSSWHDKQSLLKAVSKLFYNYKSSPSTAQGREVFDEKINDTISKQSYLEMLANIKHSLWEKQSDETILEYLKERYPLASARSLLPSEDNTERLFSLEQAEKIFAEGLKFDLTQLPTPRVYFKEFIQSLK